MIDINRESLLSLPQASAAMPFRPSIATIYRWINSGIRGVKLETTLVGGRRCTSTEAIQRFFEATNAVKSGQQVPTQTAKDRQRAEDEADKVLDTAGV